ncbi:MAG TPA: hypothetical protein VE621_15465 [Bryobacteraceae bacterium]|nr:hypothetical protein [Bryobacteraceae bacterium]
MQGGPVAAHDVLRLSHFLIEVWVVGREPIAAVWRFDQEERLPNGRGSLRAVEFDAGGLAALEPGAFAVEEVEGERDQGDDGDQQ